VAGVTDKGATLWKDGVPQYLGTKGYQYSTVRSLSVSESGDVYVAGHELDMQGHPYATLWKNGDPQRIDARENSRADCVFVSGNDVYVTTGVGTNRGWYGKLWKNGVEYNISTNGSRHVFAYSVFVK